VCDLSLEKMITQEASMENFLASCADGAA
jgi:hypothetical protein